jgi:polyhydroxyalkanoate synthesis regulator phasin
MSLIPNILEDLKKGGTPESLATIISWESLSSQDLVDLMKLARSKPDQKESYNILVFLFRVSRDKDLWFSVEVLSNAVQYLVMTALDRQALLRTMRKRLDLIKDEIGAKLPNEQELRRYWLLEASFYAVNASNLAETGHAYESGQNYQIAKGIFEQLGLTQQAEKYKAILQNLKDHGTPGTPSAPETPSPTQPRAVVQTAQPPQAAPAAPRPNPPAPQVVPFKAPPSVQPASAPPATPLPKPAAAEAQPPAIVQPPATQIPAIPSAPAMPEKPAAPAEEGSFRALPDVWVEEGRLHLPEGTQLESGSPEMLDQIHQQSEILAGIQLQVQMFLYRHSMLSQEVQNLEKKAAALKQKVERLEKKAKDLGDPE